MSIVAPLLRVLMIVAFAIGVGLPAAALNAPAGPTATSSHAACAIGQPMPQDELCRAHCLGVSVLPTIVAPPPHVVRAVALPVTRLAETAPSLWPLPEPHPPRL